MNLSFPKKEKGFALIEVLIAVTLVSGVMLGIVSSANKFLIYSNSSLKSYQATLALEEGVEAVKNVRAVSWGNISTLVSGTDYGLTFSGLNWTIVSGSQLTTNGFTRKVNFYDVYRDANNDIAGTGTLDTNIKNVVVTTTWNDSGVSKSKEIEFYIADIFN